MLSVQALVVILGGDFALVPILAMVLAFWLVVASICWGILVFANKFAERLDGYLQERAPWARPGLLGIMWIAMAIAGAGHSSQGECARPLGALGRRSELYGIGPEHETLD